MTSLRTLISRGIAQTRTELVSVYRSQSGDLRLDLWSQPGIPQARADEVEIGRYDGPVVVVQHHAGRWYVAAEEVGRVACEAILASPEALEAVNDRACEYGACDVVPNHAGGHLAWPADPTWVSVNRITYHPEDDTFSGWTMGPVPAWTQR